jgi:RsbT co-antagonist protein rsbRD N-terminal domain
MTPNPSPEQQIVGCSLSNFLADRRGQILSEWMRSVRSDSGVPAADELTVTQLKDHIPQILDELSRTLEDAFNQEIKQRAAWHAATHAQIRWQQSYDISQLIREISDLRAVLIYQLAEFHDERIPNFGGQLGLFAMVVLHSFFDRLIRIAVEQFSSTEKTNSP